MADHVEDLASTNQTHEGVKPGVWVAIGVVVLVVIFVAAGHSNSAGSSGGTTGAAQSGVMINGQPVTFGLSSFTDPATDGSGYQCDQNCDNHYAVAKFASTNAGDTTLSLSLPITITAFGSDGNAYQSG